MISIVCPLFISIRPHFFLLLRFLGRDILSIFGSEVVALKELGDPDRQASLRVSSR